MTRPPASGHLSSLGLDASDLAEPERLAWPSADVAQARPLLGEAALAALQALPPEHVTCTPCISVALDAIGVRAEVCDREPRIVKLTSEPAGSPIVLRAVGPEGSSWRPPDEHGVAWLDLSLCEVFFVEAGNGGVVGQPRGDELALFPVRRLTALDPLPSVLAPLDEWAAVADDWAATEARQAAEGGDGWGVSVAAGILARYADRDAPAGARSIVAETAAGRALPFLVRPRAWARGLAPQELRAIERLALAEVDRIHAALERLSREPDLPEGAFEDAWERASLARDDLEGVAVLLRETGRAGRLDTGLDLLDRLGASCRAGIDAVRRPRSERLRHAGRMDPSAWWGTEDE
jgi:hypothetical protein